MFYHDLDMADAENWVTKLNPHSIASFRDKTRSAAWRRIPAQAQEAMTTDVKEAGGEIVVERVFSGHSPHLSKPDVVAGFLRRAAGEKL
jgi:hypothetical protein